MPSSTARANACIREVHVWLETTERRYNDFLNMVPPALWTSKGFLFGEACMARICMVTMKKSTTYVPFVSAFGHFYEGDPMTVAEFDRFDVNDLPRRS